MFKLYQTLHRAKWLLLLTVLNIVLLVGFYFYLLLKTNIDNEKAFSIYEKSFTAYINQFTHVPELLANNRLLKAVILDPEAGNIEANQRLALMSELSGAKEAFIMDAGGQVVATSNYLSVNSFYGQNYSFRPYFYQALREQTRQYYYAKGATTGIPGFFLSAPIFDRDEVIGVAVIKLDMRQWERDWRQSGKNIMVADEHGVIILTSEDDWRYKTTKPLDDKTKKMIVDRQQFPGQDHELLYEKTYLFGPQIDTNLWKIDDRYFIVNQFTIPQTVWSLYYLVDHGEIIRMSLLFFLVSLSISVLFFMFYRERKNKAKATLASEKIKKKRRDALQTIMDNIHIGVIVFNEQGHINLMNNHAKSLANINRRSVKNIVDVMGIDLANLQALTLKDAVNVSYHETQLFKAGGVRLPIMFAVSPIDSISKNAYLMTFVNISRRKKAERELLQLNANLEETVNQRTQELKQAQNKLIQKNKTLALGNMTATIVHELNQPLTAMSSSLAAMVSKINNKNWDGAVESSNRLSSLHKKMSNIVKQLKLFSYPNAKLGECIDLSKQVAMNADRFKDVLDDANIELVEKYTHLPTSIRMSPLKLDLIISNLLQNAIDALSACESRKIFIEVVNNSSWATIIVEDNAGGVDPSVITKMFNPYFTTKEVGKGVGLGLAITYEIIQEHEGEVKVVNTPRGAKFIINLPLANEQ